ncbi:hypothetical protein HHI36_018235 [Cryptolaemus montrouzieri]|uniref:Uncharacterized protein n=1 Tax=Cryptolaemus montrouzieri TaxID=559131 RepID=A0ABD2P093_9CUCU
MSKFEIQNTQHVNLSNTKLDNQESSSYKNHKTELDKGRTEKNVEFPVNSNNSHDFDDANNSTTINKEQRSNFQRNRAQGEEYYVTDKHQRQKSPEDGNFRYQKNSAQSDRNHPQSSDKGGKYSNSRYFSSNNSSIKNNEKEFTETPRRSQDNRSDGRNRNFNNWSYKGMGRGQYVERKYGENRDSNRSYNYNQNNEGE